MNVVIVDDEPLVRDGLQSLIDWESLGFTIVGTAPDGVEGQELIDRTRPDIVLTDIKMPVVDGLQLTEWVCRRYEHSVVLIISGYGEFDLAQRAIEIGATSFLLKPVEPADLVDALLRAREIVRERRGKIEELQRLRKLTSQNSQYAIVEAVSRATRGVALDEVHQQVFRRIGIENNKTTMRIAIFATRSSVSREGNEPDESIALRRNLWNRLIGRSGDRRIVIVPETDLRFAVLVWGDSIEMTSIALEEFIESVTRTFQILGFERPVGGYSSPHRSIESLFEQYVEAESALSTAILYGEPNIEFGVHGEAIRSLNESEINDKPLIDSVARLLTAVEERTPDRVATATRDFGKILDTCTADLQIATIGYILFTVRLFIGRAGLPLSERWTVESLQTIAMHDSSAMRAATLRQLLLDVVSQSDRKDAPVNALRVARAKQIVEHRFEESSLSVEDVAAEIGMSANYLSTVFRSHTGASFIDFLTSVRVEHAKQLLRYTSLKTYEIAERSGYQYPSYFSTVFRTRVGMTPSEFRENSNGSVE